MSVLFKPNMCVQGNVLAKKKNALVKWYQGVTQTEVCIYTISDCISVFHISLLKLKVLDNAQEYFLYLSLGVIERCNIAHS